jgi:hypothetical protein
MTRSHDRVTRPSSTGDSKRVETAGDDGAEPLTAVTICETARVSAGPRTVGTAVEARVVASPEGPDGKVSGEVYVGGFT